MMRYEKDTPMSTSELLKAAEEEELHRRDEINGIHIIILINEKRIVPHNL